MYRSLCLTMPSRGRARLHWGFVARDVRPIVTHSNSSGDPIQGGQSKKLPDCLKLRSISLERRFSFQLNNLVWVCKKKKTENETTNKSFIFQSRPPGPLATFFRTLSLSQTLHFRSPGIYNHNALTVQHCLGFVCRDSLNIKSFVTSLSCRGLSHASYRTESHCSNEIP